MPFTPFKQSDGKPSLAAALEQCSLVLAVYLDAREVAEQICLAVGGATILAWTWQPTSMPPSWALLRQGNDLYFVFAGTTQVAQVIPQITGTFGAPYAAGGNKVHSFFFDQARQLGPAITAALPPDWPTCNVHWTGHSYGGAIAFFMATEWKQNVPGATVEVLSFAPPKVFTENYGGTLPDVKIALRSSGDAIPWIPSGHAIEAVFTPAGAWALGIPLDWTHYGDLYDLEASGNLTPASAFQWNQLVLGPLVATSVGEHPSTSYLQRIILGAGATGDTGNVPAVTRAAFKLLLLTPVQVQIANANADATVNVDVQNATVFLDQGGGPLTPDNLAAVNVTQGSFSSATPGNGILSRLLPGSDGMPSKCTFFFHEGSRSGFSETWYTAATVNAAQAEARTIAYLFNRLNISGAQTVFDYARFSAVPGNRNPKIVIAKDVLAAGGITSGTYKVGTARSAEESDVASTALLVEKQTADSKGRLFMRGVPDSMIIAGGNIAVQATFDRLFTTWANYMKDVANEWMYQKVDTATKKGGTLSAAVANTSGGLDLTITQIPGGLPLWNPVNQPTGDVGRKVVARISGCIFNPNMNGSLLIRITGANTAVTVKPLAINTFRAAPQALLQTNLPAYAQITGMKLIEVVERRPGRPSKLSVGRSKLRPRG